MGRCVASLVVFAEGRFAVIWRPQTLLVSQEAERIVREESMYKSGPTVAATDAQSTIYSYTWVTSTRQRSFQIIAGAVEILSSMMSLGDELPSVETRPSLNIPRRPPKLQSMPFQSISKRFPNI
jgi:hypothetical protein